MHATMKELGIDRLPMHERLALIGEIWDSVSADMQEAPISEELKAELERRLAKAEAHPETLVPWEEVSARALARAKK